MKNSSLSKKTLENSSKTLIKFSLVGKVINDNMNKTIKVLVTKKSAHPVYKKIVSHKKNYLVHDEENSAHIGDEVKIIRSRKLSKKKCFYLKEILKTNVVVTKKLENTTPTTPSETKQSEIKTIPTSKKLDVAENKTK